MRLNQIIGKDQQPAQKNLQKNAKGDKKIIRKNTVGNCDNKKCFEEKSYMSSLLNTSKHKLSKDLTNAEQMEDLDLVWRKYATLKGCPRLLISFFTFTLSN